MPSCRHLGVSSMPRPSNLEVRLGVRQVSDRYRTWHLNLVKCQASGVALLQRVGALPVAQEGGLVFREQLASPLVSHLCLDLLQLHALLCFAPIPLRHELLSEQV